MSNDNDTVQTSTETDDQKKQALSSESGAPKPTLPPDSLENVALGVLYYRDLFEMFISTIIIAVTYHVFYSYPIIVFIISCYVNFMAFYILFNLFRSMRCFGLTPKEIYPRAPQTIVLTWGLFLAGIILAALRSLAPESLQTTIIIIFLLSFFFSYYRFWSFLNIIGEKVLTTNNDCKGAIFLLLFSFIFYLIYLFGCSKGKLIPADDGLFPFSIAILLFFIAIIIMFFYFERLKGHFSQSFNLQELKKEDSREHLVFDIFVTLGIIVFTILYLALSFSLFLPNQS